MFTQHQRLIDAVNFIVSLSAGFFIFPLLQPYISSKCLRSLRKFINFSTSQFFTSSSSILLGILYFLLLSLHCGLCLRQYLIGSLWFWLLHYYLGISWHKMSRANVVAFPLFNMEFDIICNLLVLVSHFLCRKYSV